MNDFKFTEKEMLLILRRRKNISQQQVAKGINVTQAYVSNFENNNLTWHDPLFSRYKEFIKNY